MLNLAILEEKVLLIKDWVYKDTYIRILIDKLQNWLVVSNEIYNKKEKAKKDKIVELINKGSNIGDSSIPLSQGISGDLYRVTLIYTTASITEAQLKLDKIRNNLRAKSIVIVILAVVSLLLVRSLYLARARIR